jgi:N-acetylneuraminate synthase
MSERSSIAFGKRRVGLGHPPLVIAELSGNHNRSLERAIELVDAAADAGAHAVKLQTYTADIMTLDVREPGFVIEDPHSLWPRRSLYDLYEEAHTPWEWHEPLFARARARGMECLSTPFDASAVQFLERFDPPAYKVASFELTDLELIAATARTGRPIILSTGMARVAEIDDAVRTIRANGSNDIVVLKCTSTYPASPANSNIATIPHMRALFKTEVGISDHTPGVGVSVAAVALGATLIEKHLTLRRADGGVDSAFSLEPDELRALVLESERAWLGRGEITYGPSASEQASLQFRRSIYIAENVRAGEVFTERNLRVVRPGFGLEPKHFRRVLGRRAAADTKKGTPLSWELVE